VHAVLEAALLAAASRGLSLRLHALFHVKHSPRLFSEVANTLENKAFSHVGAIARRVCFT
jgi:hypothetical protein